MEKEKLKGLVINYLKNNPNPTDEHFHKFIEGLGLDPDEGEEAAYALLSDILAQGKRSKEPSKQLKGNEIDMGMGVEKEHTSNPMIAKRIAEDHLTEIPDYYTRLKKMEEEALGKEASLSLRALKHKKDLKKK